MPFPTSHDADIRLVSNSTELTEEDVRDLMPWMRQLSEAGMRRLNVELLLQNLEAVKQFERSSGRLTRWLIGLTVVLVVFSVEIGYYTFILTKIGH